MIELLKIGINGMTYLFQVSYYTDILLASVLIITVIYIIRFIRGY